jgi:hypothetical protein
MEHWIASSLRSSQWRGHNFSFSRHPLPESSKKLPPKEIRGRRKCRVHGAPAARVQQKAHGSHHRSTENTRHSLRNGFNGFLRALPGDEFLFVTVASGLMI